jgi:putative flippase GtrA
VVRAATTVPWHEVRGFIAVGVVGLLVDVGVFNLAVLAGVTPLLASLIGFCLGVVVSFLGNKALTFRSRTTGHLGRAWLTFFLINAIAVALIQLAVAVGVAAELALPALNALRLTAIGLATVGRFFAYRRWVFVESSTGSDGGSAASR